MVADLESREKEDSEACHVINIDIQDNHEEATIGAFMICDLCTMVGHMCYLVQAMRLLSVINKVFIFVKSWFQQTKKKAG